MQWPSLHHIAVIKHRLEKLERKVFIYFTVCHEGKSGQEPEAGLNRRSGGTPSTGLSPGLLSLLASTPRDGIAHSGRVLSHQSRRQANLMEAVP